MEDGNIGGKSHKEVVRERVIKLVKYGAGLLVIFLIVILFPRESQYFKVDSGVSAETTSNICVDTIWNISGSKYLYNNSGVLDANETALNDTSLAVCSVYNETSKIPTYTSNLTNDNDYINSSYLNNSLSTKVNLTGYNKANWDTAYSWGNHANAGYLTQETDPIFVANRTDIWNKINDKLSQSGGIITGNLTINGIVTIIGNVLNLTVTNIDVNGSYMPTFDNLFDLGNITNKFRTIYTTNLYADNIYNKTQIDTLINNISLTPGPQGIQGIQGIPGTNGTNGVNGTNGLNGSNATINAYINCSTGYYPNLINFSNGTATFNCSLDQTGGGSPGGIKKSVQFNNGTGSDGDQYFLYDLENKLLSLNNSLSYYYEIGNPTSITNAITYDVPATYTFTTYSDEWGGQVQINALEYACKATPKGEVCSATPATAIIITVQTTNVSENEQTFYLTINGTTVAGADYYKFQVWDEFGYWIGSTYNTTRTDFTLGSGFADDLIATGTAIGTPTPSPLSGTDYWQALQIIGDVLMAHNVSVGNNLNVGGNVTTQGGFNYNWTTGLSYMYNRQIEFGACSQSQQNRNRICIGFEDGSPRIALEQLYSGQGRVLLMDNDANCLRYFLAGLVIYKVCGDAARTVSFYQGGNIALSFANGKITYYNGITTSGTGVPYIVNRTFISTNVSIASTNLAQTSTVGDYSVKYYMFVSKANTTFNTTYDLNLTWNDGVARNIKMGSINCSSTTASTSLLTGTQAVQIKTGSIAYITTNNTAPNSCIYNLTLTAFRDN